MGKKDKEQQRYEEEQEIELTKEKKDKFTTIEDLPGIGAATGEKLRIAGFDNLLSIAVATPGEIVDIAGVTELTAKKVIKAARDNLDMGFQSGEELMKKRDSIEKLSTGSNNLNKLLGGGVETGAITECFGAYGSGKTQIGHMLTVQCLMRDPDAAVLYIDTENTFRPNRIRQFSEGLGIDYLDILRRVKAARAFNSDHQMLLVDKAEEMIKQGLKVKLIVVDSLTAHFRAEFVGRGTLAERQQKLNKHMHALAKLADMYNLAIYVSNQVMAKPDQFFGDPTEAIGGHIVAHNSTYRIYLRRGKKGTRVAKLVDAPDLADNECVFNITEAGIEDA
ncbi:MAG: DNA repair and recombination protein RadA [archaeon]